jgi:hypothetical protein
MQGQEIKRVSYLATHFVFSGTFATLSLRAKQTVSDAMVGQKVEDLPNKQTTAFFLGELRHVISAHNEIKVSNPVK